MNADRFPGVVAAMRDGRVLADNGAGTQLPGEALAAVAGYLEFDTASRGGIFRRKERTAQIVADAKDAFAELIGVPRGTIGFGLNATSTAFSLARTVAHTIRPGDRIVVTDSDHFANVMPWTWLQRFGAQIDTISLGAHGELHESTFAGALAKRPRLVAFGWASNGTGNVFDVARLSRAAKDAGALVVVDGVQAGPHLHVDVPETVDAVFFSGYKIYAPHFGAWYARPEFAEQYFTADVATPSAPVHWSMETGTPNNEGLAGWLGTIAYLRELGNGSVRTAMERIAAYERDLARHALTRFAERADSIALYGRPPGVDRLPVFAFNVRGEAPEAVARALDAGGIEASCGNFYAPRLMQTLAPETNGVAVRFSFAHYNDTKDVDRCFAALDALLGAVA